MAITVTIKEIFAGGSMTRVVDAALNADDPAVNDPAWLPGPGENDKFTGTKYERLDGHVRWEVSWTPMATGQQSEYFEDGERSKLERIRIYY